MQCNISRTLLQDVGVSPIDSNTLNNVPSNDVTRQGEGRRDVRALRAQIRRSCLRLWAMDDSDVTGIAPRKIEDPKFLELTEGYRLLNLTGKGSQHKVWQQQ